MNKKILVSSIAAMAKNRVIGVNNQLPWNIPEDLRYFREKTRSHIVIMGRKTFESVGSRPMPQRYNIIVTRQKDFLVEGVTTTHSVEEAISVAKEVAAKDPRWGDEIFVCGGEDIYRAALPYTDRIYLTEIEQSFEGSARFPEFSLLEFSLIERSDRLDPIPFAFCVYERKGR